MENLALQKSAMTFEEETRFTEINKKANNTLTADEIAFISGIMTRAANDITLGRTKLTEFIAKLNDPNNAAFAATFKNDYLKLINLFSTVGSHFMVTLENINEIFG